MPSSNDILGVILGGGRGTRLYPLTRERAKPAVPIAGKYRLIDIPISNCINSGITRIAVLTQFLSVSLHRHISRTYWFDLFHRGWVQILAAEQTHQRESWYQGNADAVRKQIMEIETTGAEWVLILAGDHIYRMDYRTMAQAHWEHGADITVGVQPVAHDQASRFGILKRGPGGRITDFAEKPKDPAIQAKFVSRDDPKKPYFGSMGIYLFNIAVLKDFMRNTDYDDFGGQVIPAALKSRKVYGFEFEGFWEDIGTIRSFYDTNLLLAQPDSRFSFYDPEAPIYTHPRFLPGSVVTRSTLHNVMLTDGCRIYESEISDSVVGLRSQVSSGTRIRKTVLLGADYYEPAGASSGIPIGIGKNCIIEGAIIDKNARIGEGVIIEPFPVGTELESEDCVVQDGIVVIPKNTTLQPGTKIRPSSSN